MQVMLPSLLFHVFYITEEWWPGLLCGLTYYSFWQLYGAIVECRHQVCDIRTAGATTPVMIDGRTTCGTGLPSSHLPFRVLLDFKDISSIRYHHQWWCGPLIGDDIHVGVMGWSHLCKDSGGSSLRDFSAYSEFELCKLSDVIHLWWIMWWSCDLYTSHDHRGKSQDHVTPWSSR